MSISTSSNTAPLWQATYDQYGLDNHLDVLEDKQNLIDLLQPKIEQHSELPAFSMGAATLTFGQLDIASRRFAAFFTSARCREGRSHSGTTAKYTAVCRGTVGLPTCRCGIGQCQSHVYPI
ncbi:hypothetical protein [Psychrobacter sp. JCM 18900]|uniref:hypothetical protein n=1 Tax=Psychrobacter sp. JCM 18900 TaxID=1298608 RepID=UPI000436C251|nr:hypothetical protein [Psychrobacter sp. JCM 18900]GAF51802.1 hypothetical protein JCM18900_283 [Psychrobacter sp. JCM 18900]